MNYQIHIILDITSENPIDHERVAEAVNAALQNELTRVNANVDVRGTCYGCNKAWDDHDKSATGEMVCR